MPFSSRSAGSNRAHDRLWGPSAPGLHQDVVVTKEDGAGTSACLAHSSAELSEVLVRVDHITLDGLARIGVIPAAIEGYPHSVEFLALRERGGCRSNSHRDHQVSAPNADCPTRSVAVARAFLRGAMPCNRRGLDPRWRTSQGTAVAGLIHPRQIQLHFRRSDERARPPRRPSGHGRPKAHGPKRYFSQGVPFSAFLPRPPAPICLAAARMPSAAAQLPLNAARFAASGAVLPAAREHAFFEASSEQDW
jgi:hypothetical protein